MTGSTGRGVRVWVASLLAAALLALTGAACGSAAGSATTSATPSSTSSAPSAGPAHATPTAAEDFSSEAFSHSATIDNPWFPVKPGTEMTYTGRVNQGTRRVERRVIFIATDLTKMIDGVQSVVIWERDINLGVLQEGEIAFYAQDDNGNVWNMGEYPEVYKNGKLTGAPDTWISGIDKALPGILMQADPQVGTTSYSQGWAPTIQFADRARVYSMGQSLTVPFGNFNDVLVTDEWDATDPSSHQLKYYVTGVGSVRVGFAGADTEQESLVLANVRQLGPQALAEARRQVQAIDARAYRVSKDPYGTTPTAKRAVP